MKIGITGIILFIKDIKKVGAFYEKKLGFKKIKNQRFTEKEWLEFDTGGCKLGLHYSPTPGSFQNNWNKFVLYSNNVSKHRLELIKKKVKIGEIFRFEKTEICDGEDPEGNRFQISNNEFCNPNRTHNSGVSAGTKKGKTKKTKS